MNVTQCDVSDTAYESGSLPEIYQLLDTVAKKLTQLQRQSISVVALTPPQYAILGLLWERDGRPLSELASACCCSPSTVTGIVDTLEKKGLVARELNPEDRRSFLVQLTEHGEALKEATPDPDRIFAGCCPSIEAEELKQLGTLLGKLNDALDA
jgi:DNA-binding MarR family transcriptional regulator